MATSNNARIVWIDMVRVTAISLVILNHSVEEIFISSLYGNEPLELPMSIFMYLFFTLGRLGVPLFLYITGILLLHRDYTNDKIIRFYKNNFYPLLKVTIIWTMLYNCFDILFYSRQPSVKNIILELLLLKQNNMPHMWYMPVILGLYLAIPFIALVLRNITPKIIFSVGVVVIIYRMALPTFIDIINICGISKSLSGILDLGFLGSCYGIYLITGYYINKSKNARTNRRHIMIFISCLIICVFFQLFAFHKGLNYKVWYDFLFLYIASLSLISLLSSVNIKHVAFVKIVTYISRNSLALYFVHMPIRFILIKYISFRSLPSPMAVGVFFLCLYAASIFCVLILEKNRLLRKHLLLIKDPI